MNPKNIRQVAAGGVQQRNTDSAMTHVPRCSDLYVDEFHKLWTSLISVRRKDVRLQTTGPDSLVFDLVEAPHLSSPLMHQKFVRFFYMEMCKNCSPP